MPDPIQSTAANFNPPIEGASVEENSGQACLSTSVPSASLRDGAPVTHALPGSPAVTSLVARFAAPTGVHQPVEPSLTQAVKACSWEVANAVVGVAASIVTPVGLAGTLLSGARSLIGVGTVARCIEREEAAQVSEGEKANQMADCERDGAMPLLKPDGSIICALP